MALPRFFARVADSLRPVADVPAEALAQRLDGEHVQLVITDEASSNTSLTHGSLLAVNLLSRLYPRLRIVAPRELHDGTASLALRINPGIDLAVETRATAGATATLAFGRVAAVDLPAQTTVRVDARGLEVAVDCLAGADADPYPLAALAAAAVGAGELFRVVFAEALGEPGRRAEQPGTTNVIAGREAGAIWPSSVDALDVGEVHLIGAGAVGQACLLALSTLPVNGRLIAIDPEVLEVSNLQRYVLAGDVDVGVAKTALAQRALTGTALSVEESQSRWGDQYGAGEPVERVLVALDSAQARIDVAASLPRYAYNAWTQPQDLGWSRHEAFGVEPCLACLYYPTGRRPSDHELIAEALGQHPLRALAYLATATPVGAPLPALPDVPPLPPPPEAQSWGVVSLLDDLIVAGAVDEMSAAKWSDKSVGDLYRDGICGGGILPIGPVGGDAIVPLAHQSALAGVMLAGSLVSSLHPKMRQLRPREIESRFDVLRGFPQVLSRPRSRTPGCICSDEDYLAVYRDVHGRPV